MTRDTSRTYSGGINVVHSDDSRSVVHRLNTQPSYSNDSVRRMNEVGTK